MGSAVAATCSQMSLAWAVVPKLPRGSKTWPPEVMAEKCDTCGVEPYQRCRTLKAGGGAAPYYVEEVQVDPAAKMPAPRTALEPHKSRVEAAKRRQG
jgi:hypothetical protein